MELNREQEATLIIAPAGAGKTTEIMKKILQIMHEKDYDPNKVLCITSSDYLGKQMRKLLREKYGLMIRTPRYMGSIYSCFLEEIRKEQNWRFLGLSNPPKLIEEWEIKNFINSLRDLSIYTSLKLWDYEKTIEMIKSLKLEISDRNSLSKQSFLKRYTAFLSEKELLDESDILINMRRLAYSKNAQIVERIQNRWKWILIDDAQDLSSVFIDVLKVLFQGGANLLITADPNQRTFEYGGIDYRAIEEIEEMCKDKLKTINQVENHITKSQIVTYCNEIRYNKTTSVAIPLKESEEGLYLGYDYKSVFSRWWSANEKNNFKDCESLAFLARREEELMDIVSFCLLNEIVFKTSKECFYKIFKSSKCCREVIDSLRCIFFLNVSSFRYIFPDESDWEEFRWYFVRHRETIEKGEIVSVPGRLASLEVWSWVEYLISLKKEKETPIIKLMELIRTEGRQYFRWDEEGDNACFENIKALIKLITKKLGSKVDNLEIIARLSTFLTSINEIDFPPMYLEIIKKSIGLNWDSVVVVNSRTLHYSFKKGDYCLFYIACSRAKENLFPI